jgi:hypothetical protein
MTPLDAYVLAYCEAYEGMSNGNWPRRLRPLREAYDRGFAAGLQASYDVARTGSGEDAPARALPDANPGIMEQMK